MNPHYLSRQPITGTDAGFATELPDSAPVEARYPMNRCRRLRKKRQKKTRYPPVPFRHLHHQISEGYCAHCDRHRYPSPLQEERISIQLCQMEPPVEPAVRVMTPTVMAAATTVPTPSVQKHLSPQITFSAHISTHDNSEKGVWVKVYYEGNFTVALVFQVICRMLTRPENSSTSYRLLRVL